MSEFSASFSQQMDRLNKQMDSLERPPSTLHTSARSRDSETSRASPYQHPRLWADRPLDDPLPQGPITWPDEEDDVSAPDGGDSTEVAEGDDTEGCAEHKVSKKTTSLLHEVFSKPVANATQRRWRQTYGMPALDTTKSPKLDNMFRPQVPKDAKEADR